jgi:hypothetical protein
MTLADFKDLTEAIQALVVTAAVLAGGVWALYRFWSLKELDKAKAELQKISHEIERSGTLNFSLTARPIHPREGIPGYFVQVDVLITNVGRKTEALDLAQGFLYTAPVIGAAKNTVDFGEGFHTRLTGWKEAPETASFAPGEVKLVPFLVPVADPGLYYIAIFIMGSPEEARRTTEEFRRAGVREITLAWGAVTYVVVNGTPIT